MKSTIVTPRIAAAVLGLMMTMIPGMQAQRQPAEPSAAPVPSQIISAKKVFIANAADDHDTRIAKYVGGPDGIYDQFYADIKSQGRFELVSAPSDADLVLEVELGVLPVPPAYARFRLAIVDPKTSILLWTISEPVDAAILVKTARKHIAESLARVTDDLKALTPGP
jgi:hypothetical protein